MAATTEEIKIALAALQSGDLVVFPTETVYGIGADARNGNAVAKIFEAKGRPSFNPLIAHVADADIAAKIADFNDTAKKLAKAFWPGPMSLVLPLRDDHQISELTTAGLDTIALRVPEHATAQTLLRAFGGPIAAPSANPSGKLSPTRRQDLTKEILDAVTICLSGDDATVGLESTILLPQDDSITILRQGAVTAEMIEAETGIQPSLDLHSEKPSSPGQLLRHYAPQTPLSINQDERTNDAVHIGFGANKGDMNLSKTGDLVEAAANLFAFLHKADRLALEKGVGRISVARIPNQGLGQAINDRLERAARG